MLHGFAGVRAKGGEWVVGGWGDDNLGLHDCCLSKTESTRHTRMEDRTKHSHIVFPVIDSSKLYHHDRVWYRVQPIQPLHFILAS